MARYWRHSDPTFQSFLYIGALHRSASVLAPRWPMWLVITHTVFYIDALGKCVLCCWTPFACLCHGAFKKFWIVGGLLAFSLGGKAGLDLTLSWGCTTWSYAFRSKMACFLFDYFVFSRDVLYSTFMAHLFWSILPLDWSPCHLGKAGVSHILHLSGIFVSTSWHRVDILLALDWSLRKCFLGRCSDANQVRSVLSSSDKGRTFPL